MAMFGISRTELQKVKDCNLIKLPTYLKGFSCDICKILDTNSEKEFMIYVKEEWAQHLVCFCRGCQCHARFSLSWRSTWGRGVLAHHDGHQ